MAVEKINQIYRCYNCGNLIEVLHVGGGTIICCNEEMKLLKEKTKDDEGSEKHVPVIEENKVKIGSIEHPMEKEHYIEWIEATDNKGFKAKSFLKPGDKPEAEFCFKPVSARAFCNIHELWKNQNS